MTANSPTRERTITGRMVLFGVLGFFALVFAVNGAFVYFALDSWPGLTTRHAYEDGLRHDEVRAAAAAQKQMGWQSRVAYGADRQLTVAMSGRKSEPVTGLTVNARVIRPAAQGRDFTVVLTEAGAGAYRAAVDFPADGLWRVKVTATDASGRRYVLNHELMVRP